MVVPTDEIPIFRNYLPSTTVTSQLLIPSSIMSSSPQSFFAHLDPIDRSVRSLIPANHSPLSHTIARNDTDIFMSHFSPIDHHSRQSPMSPSLQTVLGEMASQLRSISHHLAQSTSVRAGATHSTSINIESRPSSSQSIRSDPPLDTLSERFLRAEAEYHRLKLELAACSPVNNNNLLIPCSISRPSSSSTLPYASVLSPLSTSHPTHLPTAPESFCGKSPSAFQSISKSISPPLSITTPQFIIQPNPTPSPVGVNHPTIVSSTLLTNSTGVSPIITTSTPVTITHHDAVPTPLPPFTPLLPAVPSNSVLSPAFMMTLNNNLPTFKGLAHERPIKFITDFEIRASALVGNNDSLLLQTVQQALSDAALIWFGQLQQSTDRVSRWVDFKTRFYERYHTPVQIQTLRTELQLLFQDDTESTLDYFDRLKTLLVEIDPDCNEKWIKRKFIQKMRLDIRTRLDADINLPIRDIVRKAQNIESNIAQQKVDEKLKSVAKQQVKNTPALTTNNLSSSTEHRRRLSPLSHTDSNNFNSNNRNNFNSNNRNNNNFHSNSNHNNNNFNDASCYNSDYRSNNSNSNPSSSDRYFPNRPDLHHSPYRNTNNNHQHNNSSYSNRPDSNHPTHRHPSNVHTRFNYDDRNQSNTFVRPHQSNPSTSDYNQRSSPNNKTRYWCPHCQRHGHSWQRCSANPDGINYHPDSSSNHSKNSTGR